MARGILADPNDTTSGGFDDFMRDPVNVGLLSAVFGGLAGAQRNQPINNLGRMGMAGVMGYQNAMPAFLQQKQMDMAKGLIYGDQSQPQQPYGQVSTTAFGPNGVGSNNPSQDATAVTQAQPVRQSSMLPAGVNRQAAGLLASQGKWDELAKMIQDVSKPDIQVSNGYAYDKNKVQPGFLPQLNISQNGQAALTTIDPRTGLPVVTAPQGALGTYSSYQNAGEAAKARYNFQTFTQAGSRNPVMMTGEQASRVAGNPAPQYESAQNIQYTSPDGKNAIDLNGMTPAQIFRLAAQIKDPQDRANFMSLYSQAVKSQTAPQPEYGNPGIPLQAPSDSDIDKATGEAAINAAKAEASAAPLLQIIRQARQINPNVPSGPLGIAEGKAVFSSLPYVDHTAAKNAGLWDQLMGQNVLSTISNLASSGGIRMDIPIVKEVQKAGGIPMSLPAEARDEMLRQLESEVMSRVNAAKNIVPKLNQRGISENQYESPMVDRSPAYGNDGSYGGDPQRTVTLADIAATAKASGRSPEEVTAAMKAKGWKIGGQ